MEIDKYKAIGEMIDFCQTNCIVSYSKLLEYCRMERFDWFRVLCDNGTVVMREYFSLNRGFELQEIIECLNEQSFCCRDDEFHIRGNIAFAKGYLLGTDSKFKDEKITVTHGQLADFLQSLLDGDRDDLEHSV